MNILLMSRMVAKSGVGNHMIQLAQELLLNGHKVHVITGIDSPAITDMGGGFYVIK